MSDKKHRWRRLYLIQGAAAALWMIFFGVYWNTRNDVFLLAGIVIIIAIGIFSWASFWKAAPTKKRDNSRDT